MDNSGIANKFGPKPVEVTGANLAEIGQGFPESANFGPSSSESGRLPIEQSRPILGGFAVISDRIRPSSAKLGPKIGLTSTNNTGEMLADIREIGPGLGQIRAISTHVGVSSARLGPTLTDVAPFSAGVGTWGGLDQVWATFDVQFKRF